MASMMKLLQQAKEWESISALGKVKKEDLPSIRDDYVKAIEKLKAKIEDPVNRKGEPLKRNTIENYQARLSDLEFALLKVSERLQGISPIDEFTGWDLPKTPPTARKVKDI
jgi:hypothetical protein